MEQAAYTALCGACNVYHAAPCRYALVTQSNKNAALKNLVLQDDLNFANYANWLFSLSLHNFAGTPFGSRVPKCL